MTKPEIEFNEPFGRVRLFGPFPQSVIDAANKGIYFSNRRVMFRWLYHNFPDWQKQASINTLSL